MARLLKVSHSGYYKWIRNQEKIAATKRRNDDLKKLIKAHWDDSGKAHGARRIQADLHFEDGIDISIWLVRKLMGELGIAGVQPRRSKRTTIPDESAVARPDLIGRNFNPPVATTHLVGDITYLRTTEGWLYLATVIDLTTRMVVGWQIATHMKASIVVDALKMAYQAGYVAGNAIFHSDRGSQYTSKEFTEYAKSIDVRLSVGRTGSCLDNAVAESFFAFLKNEMYYTKPTPTRARARLDVATYIEVFYNRKRRHSTLGYLTPAAAMAQHLQLTETHKESPLAANQQAA